MDWNLKAVAAPIWDFTEFPLRETTTLLPDGLSSGIAASRDLSVDLKLGQVSNGGVAVSEKVVGPTKRARGTVNNNVVCQGQVVCCCLVDGCYADLSRCREYHRRHKVCELHSKTPEVTIGGHKQRFCQQCSRFHSLEEFDEGKRSCRKRLEGHNRRRRKPQPDPLIHPPLVNCLSNYQGTSRASPSCFSNTNHIYSPVVAAAGGTVGNQHIWLGGEAAAAHYNHQIHCFRNIPTLLSPSSSSQSAIFGSSQTLPPSRGVSGSSNDHHNSNNNNNNDDGNMYYFQQQDTDCALSLLSSPSPQILGIHHATSSSSYSTSANATTTHCTSIFGGNSPPQTLPFHWD